MKSEPRTNDIDGVWEISDAELLLLQFRTLAEDHPRQQRLSEIYAKGQPSLEFILRERRRQWTMLMFQYAALPDEERDKFCDGLAEWWRLVRANEDRAIAHLKEHRRRGTVQ
jgi:hypothetical protein